MHLKLKYIWLLILLGCALSAAIFFSQTSNNQTKNDRQHILLITLPKSGSTYLAKMIADSLGYSHARKVHFSAKVSNTSNHYIGVMEPIDISELKSTKTKIVLHVRDPRQALLSLYWHLHDDHQTEFVPNELKDWYYSQDMKVQLDWMIENLLPRFVAWIEDWVALKEEEDRTNDGIPILITTYDELVENDIALSIKILKFYAIEYQDLILLTPPKDKQVRFRNGDPGEWRFAFSRTQKERMSELVPTRLLERFNWSKT